MERKRSNDAEAKNEEDEDEDEEPFLNYAKYLTCAAEMLPAFGPRTGPRNCLDVRVPYGTGAMLHQEDKGILHTAAAAFFWEIPRDTSQFGKGKRPVLHSTAKPAARMKKAGDIAAAWQELFRRRRAYQPDDTQPIEDEDTRADIWNTWSRDWLAANLTQEQQKKTRSQKTSIFNAYMKGAYGDKRFVFAMLQTGITWAPSAEQLSGIGAAEHAASRFVSWVRAVVSAIESQRGSSLRQRRVLLDL